MLIAGFVIEGTQPAQVLLRGIGPALGGAPFSGQRIGAASDQPLRFVGRSGPVNSGWGDDPTLSAAFAQSGAFALPTSSTDAAMVAVLPQATTARAKRRRRNNRGRPG